MQEGEQFHPSCSGVGEAPRRRFYFKNSKINLGGSQFIENDGFSSPFDASAYYQ